VGLVIAEDLKETNQSKHQVWLPFSIIAINYAAGNKTLA